MLVMTVIDIFVQILGFIKWCDHISRNFRECEMQDIQNSMTDIKLMISKMQQDPITEKLKPQLLSTLSS